MSKRKPPPAAGPSATGQPPPVAKRISLDEALDYGLRLHREGRLGDAEAVYRQILAAVPEQPDALHFLGVLCHQSGRSEEALKCIAQALAARPEYADAHNNLGNVLKELGRLEEAAEAYRRTTAIQPTHADAHSNLGVVLRGLGRLEEAEMAYRMAIEQQPEHVEAQYNLGNLLKASGRLAEAASAYRAAIAVQPGHSDAHRNLLAALERAGRSEEIAAVFEQWLRHDPDNPIARHMLAAHTGEDVPDRAADGYVQAVFDGLAGEFEAHLQAIGYRAPALLATAIGQLLPTPQATLEVLDAGCGTGLCGPLLRPYARRLAGVDLSPRMLAHARSRGVYDALIEAELGAFLAGAETAFDLIVAADTLVYFGRLDWVLQAAARALHHGGWLAFTVERAGADEATAGFRLNPHGRYSHSEPYLVACLREAGLVPVTLEVAILRHELGEPVTGIVAVAQKAASSRTAHSG